MKKVVVVVFILVIAGAALLGGKAYLQSNKAAQLKKLRPNFANPLGKSILEFAYNIDSVESGKFEVITPESKTKLRATFPKVSGTFVRLSDGTFYTNANLDVALIQKLMPPVEESMTSMHYPPRHTLSSEQQYDMLGLSEYLDVIPINIFRELTRDVPVKDPNSPQDAAILKCQNAIKKIDRIQREYFSSLKPTYKKTAPDTYEWIIEPSSLYKRINMPELTSSCSQSSDPIVLAQHRNKIIFKTQILGNNRIITISHQITYQNNTKDVTDTAPVISLKLTDINSAVQIHHSQPVSAFNKFSRFYVAIDECKKLPVVASSGLASYTYTVPGIKYYSGPATFDSTYYCTEQEAKDAGFRMDIMQDSIQAQYKTEKPTADFDIYVPSAIPSRYIKSSGNLNGFPATLFLQYRTSVTDESAPYMEVSEFKLPDYFNPPANCTLGTNNAGQEAEKIYKDLIFPCPSFVKTPKNHEVFLRKDTKLSDANQFYYVKMSNTFIMIKSENARTDSDKLTKDELSAFVDSLHKATPQDMQSITISEETHRTN